jgi:hypothetical protein
VQLNAAGSHVFYQIPDSGFPNTLTDLMTLDVATGAATQFATAESGLGGFVSFDISDDGSLAVFIRLGQAWIVHGNGTGLMQIANVQDRLWRSRFLAAVIIFSQSPTTHGCFALT